MHITIIGCGQLSRMLALAGIPLGFKFSFINDLEQDTACVDGLGHIVKWRPGDSFEVLYAVLGNPDLVTVEKEQVDVSLLAGLEPFCKVYPDSRALSICQHRHLERQLLNTLKIPCADFVYGESLTICADRLSLPIVIKSCRGGYDGKNQWVLKTHDDIERLDKEFKTQQVSSTDYIAEQWIPFDQEVSQVSVRAEHGELQHYPLTENYHSDGILRQSIAPAPNVSASLVKRAQDYMSLIVKELDYVGVIAMECFVTGDELVVNELAPRVHNSGHWTQSGSKTCQFENHLRAITGAALGCTANHGLTGMVNLIGTCKPNLDVLLPDSKLYWYDKSVRPGRKLGHINFHEPDVNQLLTVMGRFTAKTENGLALNASDT